MGQYLDKTGLGTLWSKIKDKFVAKPTVTTIYSTNTLIYSSSSSGSFTTKSIVLTSSVQSGDKVKVYLCGSSSYKAMNSCIMEFELYSPTSTSLAGSCTTMPSYGSQRNLVTAYIQENGGSTSTAINFDIYAMDASQYAQASSIYIYKIERLR